MVWAQTFSLFYSRLKDEGYGDVDSWNAASRHADYAVDCIDPKHLRKPCDTD